MARPACKTTTTISRIRDGFASMAETTGYLCFFEISIDGTQGMSGLNIQVSEQENGGHGKTNADECVVERCDICQNAIPLAIQAAAETYEPKATKTQAPQGSR
jgi:hypothetical protein